MTFAGDWPLIVPSAESYATNRPPILIAGTPEDAEAMFDGLALQESALTHVACKYSALEER